MLDCLVNLTYPLINICVNCVENSVYFTAGASNLFVSYTFSIINNFFIHINLVFTFFEKTMFIEKNYIFNKFVTFTSFFHDFEIKLSTLLSLRINKNLVFFINTLENSLYLYTHPEVIIFNVQNILDIFLQNIIDIDPIYNSGVLKRNSNFLLINALNFFIMIYFFTFFLNLYSSFFTNSNKEESTVDNDMFLNNIAIESEKEIGSFDDVFIANIIFVLFFGWYFYINFFLYFSFFPELSFIFILLPIFYLIIIIIPLSLLFDFGINYLVYLKGVNSSSIFIVEFVFDFIACTIFFNRLLVQGVRLVLMLFTFSGFNELVITFSYLDVYTPNINLYLDSILNLNIETYSNNLIIISVLPFKFLYFMYELLHTYFVITVQSLAFFAMVFWLFLFLYTTFISEKIENHFHYLRKN